MKDAGIKDCRMQTAGKADGENGGLKTIKVWQQRNQS